MMSECPRRNVGHIRHLHQYWLDGDYVQQRPIGFYPALNCNYRSSIQAQHDFMEVGGFNIGDLIFREAREMGEPDRNCEIQEVDKPHLWLSSIFIAWMTELLLHSGGVSTHSKSGVPRHARGSASVWWGGWRQQNLIRRPIFVRFRVKWNKIDGANISPTTLGSFNQPPGCRPPPLDRRRSQTFDSWWRLRRGAAVIQNKAHDSGSNPSVMHSHPFRRYRACHKADGSARCNSWDAGGLVT